MDRESTIEAKLIICKKSKLRIRRFNVHQMQREFKTPEP